MKVKALVNFEYPASQTVRNRIRSEQIAGRRLPVEQRGRIVEVQAGEEVNAPPDLLQSWIDAGLVEDPEEATSPQPSPESGEGAGPLPQGARELDGGEDGQEI